MKWSVYRQTPTEEVWACMDHAVEAESGEAAIAAVSSEFASSQHLLGHYFAVPDDAHVFRFVRGREERRSWVELMGDTTVELRRRRLKAEAS